MKKNTLMRTGLVSISAFALLVGVAQQAKADGQGTDHGFFWSLFHTGGSSTISFPNAGKFAGNYAINWSNVGDSIGGKGWNPGAIRNVGYNCGSISGFNNFSVYGWTTGPLIEYYICEMGSVVPNSGTFSHVNNVSSDNHTYAFWKHLQQNQPSIQGTATFWQYLDNWGGQRTGVNGSVNTGNHISNWKNNGGQGFGSFTQGAYQILATEAFGGKSGSVNATVWQN
jgi:endo-1,4-beta-xylanase